MENHIIHREQVKRNITENIFGGDINKGVISDAFGHTDEILYPKTGKEMKEKLATVLTTKAAVLEQIVTKAKYLCDYVGKNPCCSTPDYYFHNKEEVMKMCSGLDNIYEDKMCYLNSNQDITLVPRGFAQVDPDAAPNKDVANACNEYNKLVRSACELCKDISYAKTMLDNIDDKKTYSLNISQLRALNC